MKIEKQKKTIDWKERLIVIETTNYFVDSIKHLSNG